MPESLLPPVAPQIPKELVMHGDTRIDPYYWLRDRTAPETIAYLEAENRYTEAVLASSKPLETAIYNEIIGRIQQTDLSVPVRKGDYYSYARTEEGKQYPIYCRKPAAAEAEEQVMLDGNQMAEGKEYFALGGMAVSHDQKLLAYSVDYNGSERFTLEVKDLTTGAILPDRVPETTYGLAWANDNRTIFYVTFDATQRPEKVWRHRLGTDSSQDQVVFTEADPLFTFELRKTRSSEFILITSVNASTTSDVHFLSADTPDGDFRVVEPRRTGVEYYVEHQADHFLIRTNDDGAVNFKLMSARVTEPSRSAWHPIRPEQENSTLDDVEAFQQFLVLSTREKGLPAIHVQDWGTGQIHAIDFPEPAYSVATADNPEYHTSVLRFTYESMVTPATVFDYDMRLRTRELKKQMPVLGGYRPEDYQAERTEAVAPDGARVPISLVHRKGLVRNGDHPCLLQAYGSYGLNSDPHFSIAALSLLDRGFVVAVAHVRGGAEYGRRWFESGRLLNKRNTFTDFIACAEHLIAEGYTSAARLAATGGSAGGLLMGAIANMRPDLFRSIVARVPFVDVVTTMLDPTIPLTTGEYDQWGNPEIKLYYDYMKSYSPYDNVEAKAYPNMLVTTGLNDPRVAYWEPAKWVAKLRAMKTDSNLLLLKTEMGAGHGGPSGRYERYRETALIYAFLVRTCGAPEQPQPSSA
ncbi:MAG: oligopeptidase B [Steroidobacteraceae bacterium]